MKGRQMNKERKEMEQRKAADPKERLVQLQLKMRIFVKTLTWMTIPIEAESFDTIDYVKGLIEEKEGFLRYDYELSFVSKTLEDSETLAQNHIQKESTLHMQSIRNGGGTPVYIETVLGKIGVFVGMKDTSNDLKARIEVRTGIPVIEQRLMFSGEEIRELNHYFQHGDTIVLVRLPEDAVDIAAVQARRKRARKDSSSAAPCLKKLKKGLLSCGVNSIERVESFWDEKDFGLAWRKSRPLISPHDTSKLKMKSHRDLVESVASDCARTLNVTTLMESQLQEYEVKLSELENKVKQLTEENGHVKDSLRKEKESRKKLEQALDVECSTGFSFLESEDGRRHIVTLERRAAKCAVDDFKSRAIRELVMDRAMSVYDDVVKECQKLLRESGRVSEDIIQLLDLEKEEDRT